MISGQARLLLAQAGGALAVAVLVAGCGSNYRPTVTPVASSGPPAQVTSYAVAVSAPSPTAPGVATIIDYSGDSVIATAQLCPSGSTCGAPLAFTIDEFGGTGYTFNSDHTITNFPISTTLQQKNELVTTLSPTAMPVNLSATASSLWISDLDGNTADLFTGSPQNFKLSIPIGTASAPASTPVLIAGAPTASGQRQYVISQNLGTAANAGIACNASPTTGPLGTATPIESTSLTADVSIPVGRCPVFALQSPDQRRLFVLNRGDDTITVIDSQKNALDDSCPRPTGCVNQNGQTYFTHPVLPLSTASLTATNAPANCNIATNPTCGMGSIAGPVYAEYNLATSQIVVANYDGNSISVIDVSLDQYGNDSPTFGTTYTIPVGPNPASVTVLFDGSRAYTANQANGTVTIVNLSSHTVEKTLAVVGHPRTVVSTQNSLFGKVYVASPDSNSITIIQTTTDLVDTTILVQGNVLDVRTTTQNGGSQSVVTYNGTASVSNPNYSSRVAGWGQPCNMPGVPAPTGSQTPLQACQAIP